MNAIHVRRVQMRCRVRSGGALEQQRAQRIFRDDLALALEDAVAEAGVGDEEQICIRTLHLSARLWMGMTDDALRREFAGALAAQIRLAIASGDGSDVVRYVSEIAAVLDALRSIARADGSRQWAWRQLGLVTAIAPGGRRADAICELLLSRPRAIVPALRALADEPPYWQLLSSLEDAQLVLIADAALGAARLPFRVAAVTAPGAITHLRGRRMASVARRARVARLLDAQASPARSIAIAVLAALDAEPSLLRGDTRRISVAIGELLEEIRASRGLPSSLRRASLQADHSTRHDLQPSAEAESPTPSTDDRSSFGRPPANESRRPANESPVTAPIDTDHRRHVDAPDQEANPREAGADGRAIGTASTGADASSSSAATPENLAAPSAPREERQRVHSDWAGLLFLINVLRDSAAIDPLLDDPALAARPASWVLHRLALLLVPAEPSDAAALVFAGLPLGESLDAWVDESPTDAEQHALLRHARACIRHTCAQLSADASEAVLYNVCARRGEIVADPGWVTVRFPIDTVDLEVRRAGLDLNPDYVSWLGMVVRFAYV